MNRDTTRSDREAGALTWTNPTVNTDNENED